MPNPAQDVAFALVATLPRGEDPIDMLFHEQSARALVEGCGVTLPPPYDRTPTLEDLLSGVEPPPGDEVDQFPAVRTLRRGLAMALFGQPEEAHVALSGLARTFVLVPQWSDGTARFVAQEPGWGPALAAFTVLPVAELHLSGRIDRVKRCGARWCELPYLDESPGRRRRFCSPRCSGRVRQARNRWGSASHLLVPAPVAAVGTPWAEDDAASTS